MITETLIVIDASIFVISLGMIELNLSVVWIEKHDGDTT